MQIPDGATRQKKCKKCGFIYKGDDIERGFFFEKKFVRHALRIYYRSVCKRCEQRRRTELTRRNRWRAKIRNTTRRHAEKLNIAIRDLQEKYGWDIEQMSHDVEFQYGNGCPECHDLFKEMGNGLRDITLDIWDPRLKPDYSNTKWMCSTCNTAKGDKTPEEWIEEKRLWREWDAYMAKQSKEDELHQLPLGGWETYV